MNWEAIGAVGQVVGALAVIATIVYLAFQVRQNTQSIRASALNNSISTVCDSRRAITETTETANIWNRGLKNHADLNEDELLRFRAAMQNAMWALWNTYAQSKLAGLSEGVWDAQKPLLRRILSTQGGSWFWSTYQQEFESSFVAEIDRIRSASSS